ncbi:MAG: hypothetical protein ACFFA4_08100 [Promethearchaeota archaeon]
MSSGNIEQNYFRSFQDGSLFDESVIFYEDNLHKSHQSESKSHKEKIYNMFQVKMQDPILDNHFNMIEKIHFILKNSQDLTQNQKYNYCMSQRFFMKLYLKRISERI